ncbi:MAG TPA: hypothetical protein VKB34_15095, partial [Povalibacter sp.]|nr:hypothetical protein [Povalibacter sp.]
MRVAALLLLAVSAVAADGAVVSEAPESVVLTVYRDSEVPDEVFDSDSEVTVEDGVGLAMVTETRTVDLPAGSATIVFRGVADGIVPQTAALEGLSAAIVEGNFDYDLLTPGGIVAKSLDRPVRLVRTDPATGKVSDRRGVLRSGPDGVLLEIDGHIEALGCSGLQEKLVFDAVPDSLSEQPTLSVNVRSTQAGRHTVKLSYLALGMTWSANYVASIRPDGSSLDLLGWLTLVNLGDTSFANAPVQVVAGELSRDREETMPPGAADYTQQKRCWPIGKFFQTLQGRFRRARYEASPAVDVQQISGGDLDEITVTGYRGSMAEQRELGDYKSYLLPEPTTVAARQSKQVAMLHQENVRFDRVYTYRVGEDTLDDGGDPEADRPRVELRMKNAKDTGLGKPLPSGVMSVMETTDAGQSVLAGQDAMDDIPVGSPVEIELGRAMDVWVQPRVTEE